MTATVVLFPIAGIPKAGDIARTKEGQFYLLSKFHTTINPQDLTRMEIHIVSNDSIQKDDYYINDNAIFRRVDMKEPCTGRKIICTTDKILISDNIQALAWDFVILILGDLNKSALKPLYYDTKLMNPLGRAINPLDLSLNKSGCKWVYSLSYDKPFVNDEILEKPVNELLAQVDFDGTTTPTPQYTSKQVKVLLYRYIKEVSGKPIFDSDEQWINENAK